jgi:hypothetical protein
MSLSPINVLSGNQVYNCFRRGSFPMMRFTRFNFLFLLSGLWLLVAIGCTANTPSISPTPPATDQVSRPTQAFDTGLVEIIPSPAITLTPQPGPTPSDALLWDLLAQIDRDRVLTDLRRITGEEPICADSGCYTISSRKTGSEGLQWAKQYIIAELQSVGYEVQLSGWSRSEYSDENLIFIKQGTRHPSEQVYFVAHLDGAASDREKRYPGADDNASGVIAVLELARIIHEYPAERTLVFFFSTGEEQGSLGVNSYLDQLSPEDIQSIQYVVNIDMIGYDADQDRVMQIFHGNRPDAKVLSGTMKELMSDYRIALTPVLIKGCP